MGLKKVAYILIAFILIIFCSYLLQNKKTGTNNDTFSEYALEEHWLKLSENISLGNPTGLGIDTNQNIVLFHRANREWPLLGTIPKEKIKENTILIIDYQSGNIINSWGSDLFTMPHGLTVDLKNNIWVTDVGLHQVFKFNHDGKLLMVIGEAGVSGNDATHFDKPTDVAICKDGSFYISDGYGNSRIIKFSAEGKYILEWGKKGSDIGEFNIPHGICLDQDENILVADRENDRIQKFNKAGKFLKAYINKNFGAVHSIITNQHDRSIICIDDLSFLKIKHRGSDIIIMDSTGKIKNRFGRSGSIIQSTCWFHDLVMDKQGSIYVGDILQNRVLKFRREGIKSRF
jgi:peptidylamidoglycolate lyase